MSRILTSLRRWWYKNLSQPVEWRPLVADLFERRVERLLEIGVGDGTRARRLIDLARWANPAATVNYTGIDLFEARSSTDSPGMSLKVAHRELAATGAKVRLVPGDPLTALARIANSLGGQQLVLVAADQSRDALARAWFYVPRLLAPEAAVWVEDLIAGKPHWRPLPSAEVQELAGRSPRRAA